MKRFIFAAGQLLIMGALIAGASTLLAQPYPNRPIQLIIANVPGSLMDINSRALSEELGKILGTQIIPINKPGAGTVLGTEAVARSKKDGYTLGYISNSAMVYARILNPETIHYDPEKDLEPLGLHVLFPQSIAVQTNSPWKTFNELVGYAKKNPGKLRVSTMGMGSIAHFALEVIQSLTGAQFTHVPFKGGESVITALLGGHVEVTCDTITKFVSHVESGKLRVLLMSYKMPGYPHVPTMMELGYKQDLPTPWFALYAPSGLPEEVKKVLMPAVEKAIKNPELKAKIEKMQFVVHYESPIELKSRTAEEYEEALAIAQKIGLGKMN